MFELALEIANMTEKRCTPEELVRLMAIHKIYRTEAGERQGFDTSFATEQGNVYLTLPEPGIVKMVNRYRSDPDCDHQHDVLLPSDEGYRQKLWERVRAIRDEIRSWFDDFIENECVDFQRVKDCMKDMTIKVVAYAETDDPWQPDMGMSFDHGTLKSYIISHEIIWTLYRNAGNEFQRIRRCPECGKYFYAKDLRKVFCSTKCRNANAYKLRKEQN